MKQHIQTTLLGFAILLILSSLVVNAETAKTTTSAVTYHARARFHEERYDRFFPNPPPEGFDYHTQMIASANIDDTPGKENIVLIVVDTKPRAPSGNGHQAFLLITDTQSYSDPKKKDLFKLYDSRTHQLEVRAKVIELHEPPFVLKQPTDTAFRLVDLTGDGTLDIWVESAYGVALISFENGAFKEVFNNSPVTGQKLAETPDVEYHFYDPYDFPSDPEGEKYHRFLAMPPPETLSYTTRMKAIANIDDTPKKETIVLMVTQPRGESVEWGQWNQAFLLIAENTADELPKKKDLFKLFASRAYPWDVPAKTIKVQSAPFVFREFRSAQPWGFQGVSFELVDLTGDGILDLWVEHAYGIAVISFQDGEFKAVCSAHSSTRRKDPMAYIDLDNDGIYEIKVPDRIIISGIPGASYPEWMSLYKWDGNTYVLNNERFYAENDKFLIDLLNLYNHVLIRYGRFDEYSFCIGLVFYYRGNTTMARKYLQWVTENAENDDYIHAAEDLLKKLPPQ